MSGSSPSPSPLRDGPFEEDMTDLTSQVGTATGLSMGKARSTIAALHMVTGSLAEASSRLSEVCRSSRSKRPRPELHPFLPCP